MNDALATTYDDVPYGFRAFSAAHPMRIAASALLRGVAPAPVSGARILEVGCAEAGLLVHLGEEHPTAELVGLELSAGQVARAVEHVEAVGITNVEVRHADVLDVDPAALGTFDYVIAHGVYSWVPPAVRDRVLALVHELLRPTGVAYVSYNTLPGGHSLGVLRMLLLDATRDATDTGARVAGARRALADLMERSDPASPYEAQLRADAVGAAEAVDADLAHDFLELWNDPVYLRQFAAHAAAHGLRYVDDLVVPFPVGGPGGPTADDVRAAQRDDLLHGASLRAAVLCRDDLVPGGRPDAAAWGRLHAAALSEPAGAPHSDDGLPTRCTLGEVVVDADTPSLRIVCAALAEAFPASVPVADLVRAVETRPGATATDRTRLLDELEQLHHHRLVYLTDGPLRLVTAVSDRPTAAAACRRGVACGEPAVNRWYEPVDLEPPYAELLALLDGTRGHDEIVDALVVAAVARGAEAGEPAADPAQVRAACAEFVADALEQLAAVGLLVD